MTVHTEPSTPDAFEELQQLVPRLPGAVERKRFGQALDAALNEIRKVEPTIASFEALVPLIRLLPSALSDQNAQRSLRDIKKVGGRLAEAGDQKSLSSVAGALLAVTSAVNVLQDQLRRAWIDHLERQFAGTEPLAQLLSRLAKTGELGRTFQAIAVRAQRTKTDFPPRDATLAELSELERDHKQARDRLRDELDADDAVVSFLLDVSSRGRVPLDRLNHQVQRWLEMHEAIELFEIALRHPADSRRRGDPL